MLVAYKKPDAASRSADGCFHASSAPVERSSTSDLLGLRYLGAQRSFLARATDTELCQNIPHFYSLRTSGGSLI